MKKKLVLILSVIVCCFLIFIIGGAAKNSISKNMTADKLANNKTAAVNKINKDKALNNAADESNNEAGNIAGNSALNNTAQSTNAAVNSADNKNAVNNSSTSGGSSAGNAAKAQASGSNQSNKNVNAGQPGGSPASAPAGGQQAQQNQPSQPASTSPNFEIINGLDGSYIVAPVHMDFAGQTVGDVTLSALQNARISKECTGNGNTLYFQSIKGLSEKANGSNSGWIYYVNGNTPDVSCGAYPLKAGDTVKWVYSRN